MKLAFPDMSLEPDCYFALEVKQVFD